MDKKGKMYVQALPQVGMHLLKHAEAIIWLFKDLHNFTVLSLLKYRNFNSTFQNCRSLPP